MSYWEELKHGSDGSMSTFASPRFLFLVGDDTGKRGKKQILTDLEPGWEDKSLGNAGLWIVRLPVSGDTSAAVISDFFPGKKLLPTSLPGVRGQVQPWANV